MGPSVMPMKQTVSEFLKAFFSPRHDRFVFPAASNLHRTLLQRLNQVNYLFVPVTSQLTLIFESTIFESKQHDSFKPVVREGEVIL